MNDSKSQCGFFFVFFVVVVKKAEEIHLVQTIYLCFRNSMGAFPGQNSFWKDLCRQPLIAAQP